MENERETDHAPRGVGGRTAGAPMGCEATRRDATLEHAMNAHRDETKHAHALDLSHSQSYYLGTGTRI